MRELKIQGILIAIILFLIIGLVSCSTYFEMKHFNECTGSNATYFDAMFTDLKVFECKKGK